MSKKTPNYLPWILGGAALLLLGAAVAWWLTGEAEEVAGGVGVAALALAGEAARRRSKASTVVGEAKADTKATAEKISEDSSEAVEAMEAVTSEVARASVEALKYEGDDLFGDDLEEEPDTVTV